MVDHVIVVGCDPGFAKFGVAKAELYPSTHEEPGDYIVEATVIRTAKDSRKGKVLATDDNFRRAQELYDALDPFFAIAHVITAEGISHSRNASSMTKVGMAWGVLAALARRHQLPVVQATPQRIKKVMCNVQSASKDQVQAAVEERYGDLTDLLSHIPPGQREHAYDAAGSIVACLDSNEILALRRSKADG